ncbi:MAG TPA: pyridoxal-phosphate dependent enzyme [Patescibacteria group bacterium]|nr:pyridoxal-phosphate dependent enzyme [Patescibacteria group bacterium]
MSDLRVDVLTCDRPSRTLTPEEAAAEIAHITHHYTDPDRLAYTQPPVVACDVRGSTTCILDATQNSGRSFKAISMSNYPAQIEMPVIASAGNAALGLADATLREGKSVAVFAPRTILDSKREALLQRPNVQLDTRGGTFEEALDLARWFAHTTEGATIMSGSGATAIAALVKTLARNAVLTMQELQERNGIKEVTAALQLGAGSLATACCVAIREAVNTGVLRPNTSIVLGTSTVQDKSFFDGLNVVRQGPHATAIVNDGRYVDNRVKISLTDAARAREIAAAAFPEYLPYGFEPTGLAGIATVLKDLERVDEPAERGYVCVLSGTNGSLEINKYLDNALLGLVILD